MHPNSSHSFEEIVNAGAIIADDIPVSGNQVPKQIRDAFLVSNQCRNAHAHPMRSIHASVRYHARKDDHDGLTAARIKRMYEIRRKLRRINRAFHEFQDLGGCRVILATIAGDARVVAVLKQKLPSIVSKEDDYITKPKKTGYRSHHLDARYCKTLEK